MPLKKIITPLFTGVALFLALPLLLWQSLSGDTSAQE
jgi:hypothetical protein